MTGDDDPAKELKEATESIWGDTVPEFDGEATAGIVLFVSGDGSLCQAGFGDWGRHSDMLALAEHLLAIGDDLLGRYAPYGFDAPDDSRPETPSLPDNGGPFQ